VKLDEKTLLHSLIISPNPESSIALLLKLLSACLKSNSKVTQLSRKFLNQLIAPRSTNPSPISTQKMSDIHSVLTIDFDHLEYTLLYSLFFLSFYWCPNLLKFADFLCIWLTSSKSVLTVWRRSASWDICLASHSTVCPSTFGSQSCFLNSDGSITFDLRVGISV
jgi:hypothetical protein